MSVFEYSGNQFHYWNVVPDQLAGGETPVGYERAASKRFIKHLLDEGMRTFISLQEEDEVVRKDFAFYHDALAQAAEERGVEASFVRVPFMDGSTINKANMLLLLDMIDASIARGQPVYLHCLAGAGRTGTVIGCWLVRHGMDGEAALAHIIQLREQDPWFIGKPAPQKPGQCERVRQWQE